MYQSMKRFQKINHFPRTSEITRKDQLCRNVQRMQEMHGARNFDFIPESFVLPQETDSYLAAASHAEDATWIKPAAKACGRGIYVTKSAEDAAAAHAQDQNVLVSRYIERPLLMEGRKFDLRVYVCVTSFNPL